MAVVLIVAAFISIALSRVGTAEAMRSDRDSLFHIGLLSNKPLLGAVVLTFGLQMAVIYIPGLQAVFRMISLSAIDLLLSFSLTVLIFGTIELEKWLIRCRSKKAT
jgi:Ca2+-transporting ATPase